jgi:hypothetical protein
MMSILATFHFIFSFSFFVCLAAPFFGVEIQLILASFEITAPGFGFS